MDVEQNQKFYQEIWPQKWQKATLWLSMFLASFILNSPSIQNVLLLLEPECSVNGTSVCHCPRNSYELQIWNGNLVTDFRLLCDRSELARPDLFFNIGVVSSCFFGIFFDAFEVSFVLDLKLNIRI